MAREVNKEEFYEAIGCKDVTVTPKGNYPFRTDFSYKNGQRVGYVQDIENSLKSKYYLDN